MLPAFGEAWSVLAGAEGALLLGGVLLLGGADPPAPLKPQPSLP